MRRLWIAVSILVLVFCITLLNSAYLFRFTVGLVDLLGQAEQMAENGDWSTAGKLTQEAMDTWHSHDNYLYTVLRHGDTDGVHIGFREVQAFIDCEEEGEYSAANAELMTQIELLYEMEQLTLQNLL